MTPWTSPDCRSVSKGLQSGMVHPKLTLKRWVSPSGQFKIVTIRPMLIPLTPESASLIVGLVL